MYILSSKENSYYQVSIISIKMVVMAILEILMLMVMSKVLSILLGPFKINSMTYTINLNLSKGDKLTNIVKSGKAFSKIDFSNNAQKN